MKRVKTNVQAPIISSDLDVFLILLKQESTTFGRAMTSNAYTDLPAIPMTVYNYRSLYGVLKTGK